MTSNVPISDSLIGWNGWMINGHPSSPLKYALAPPEEGVVSHYTLTDRALIEISGRRKRIYGRWDVIFRCWEVWEGRQKEYVIEPEGILFDEWGQPTGYVTDEAGEAAIIGYFSLVSVIVRVQCSQKREKHWAYLLNKFS